MNEFQMDPDLLRERLSHAVLYREAGKITKSLGLIYEAQLPGASVGSLCRILPSKDSKADSAIEAEVVGFRDKRVILMPFEEATGINNDSRVLLQKRDSTVQVGASLLGRVIDARGEPLDGKGPLFMGNKGTEQRSLYREPAHPLDRKLVNEPLDLGVRAINGLLTCGKGQRVGILAGSGVGKSVLLGMMARRTVADVNVIALVGERGREVREFIESDLGPEGLKRSVVIVATSDKSPLLRMRAAFLATTISEYFRDHGLDVLMLMDSLTRFCMAQREIGLSMGEPPTSRGYTPSVFSIMPKILERAGTRAGAGSITGLYTILVEGDDIDDPIGDSARSILDGHWVLSRKLAQRNQFPAIDILASASRVMRAVTTPEHTAWASKLREWMAAYNQAEDLINIGAYVRGSNARIDTSIVVQEKILDFLKQGIGDAANFSDSLANMRAIVQSAEAYSASMQQMPKQQK